MSDKQVIDDVRARCERDGRLDHPGVLAISERGGTVTLRGTVRSLHQRHAAIEVTRSVRGVRRVADELVVDPRDHWDDAEIRGAALNALIADPGVPAEKIDVTVANGWLTLSGQVRRQSESSAAFDAVAGLPRVGGMTNKIQVVTAGGR
jgi:osmotically-inducible protein OsmY